MNRSRNGRPVSVGSVDIREVASNAGVLLPLLYRTGFERFAQSTRSRLKPNLLTSVACVVVVFSALILICARVYAGDSADVKSAAVVWKLKLSLTLPVFDVSRIWPAVGRVLQVRTPCIVLSVLVIACIGR